MIPVAILLKYGGIFHWIKCHTTEKDDLVLAFVTAEIIDKYYQVVI